MPPPWYFSPSPSPSLFLSLARLLARSTLSICLSVRLSVRLTDCLTDSLSLSLSLSARLLSFHSRSLSHSRLTGSAFTAVPPCWSAQSSSPTRHPSSRRRCELRRASGVEPMPNSPSLSLSCFLARSLFVSASPVEVYSSDLGHQAQHREADRDGERLL